MGAYPPTTDACLSLFSLVWPTHFDFPHQAAVLEIGCAEADWLTPLHQVRSDLRLTGIDWRTCDRPGAQTVIKGDVLTQEFPAESFDAIVLISALEHIGLGHYHADPLAVDGDVQCLDRVWTWLKPGGLLYFDVPWNPDPGYDVLGTECRVYDDRALVTRLPNHRYWGQFRAYSDLRGTRFIPRPTTKAQRFWYVACVWAKPPNLEYLG